MITYLGLAHIRPYGYDLDRLDGLGGGMVTYLDLHTSSQYRLDGLGGWVGGVGWGGNIPWTCIHTTISCRCRLCARPRTQTHNERKDPKEKPIPANIAIKAC